MAYEAEERVRELSEAASRVVGADHVGVDILPTGDGDYVVLEVNTIPGWRALRRVVDVDPVRCVVDHVLETMP